MVVKFLPVLVLVVAVGCKPKEPQADLTPGGQEAKPVATPAGGQPAQANPPMSQPAGGGNPSPGTPYVSGGAGGLSPVTPMQDGGGSAAGQVLKERAKGVAAGGSSLDQMGSEGNQGN